MGRRARRLFLCVAASRAWSLKDHGHRVWLLERLPAEEPAARAGRDNHLDRQRHGFEGHWCLADHVAVDLHRRARARYHGDAPCAVVLDRWRARVAPRHDAQGVRQLLAEAPGVEEADIE